MLVKYLEKLTIGDVRIIEENFDEQFKALKYFYENTTNKQSFPLLVLLNALVSYQLNTTGEDYWWEFSKYFANKEIKNEVEAMKEFLRKSKGNKRFLSNKLKRLDKIKSYVNYIKSNYIYFYENMIELRDFLAKVMNQDIYAKTIVFSVKMFGYSMRIATGRFIPYPFEIAIPVDSRIRKITQKLTNENPIKFWFRISKETRIPPLHIDSIIWTLYRKDIDELKKYLDYTKIEILRKIREIILK